MYENAEEAREVSGWPGSKQVTLLLHQTVPRGKF